MTYPRRMITKTAFTPGGPSPTGSAPGIWRLDEVAYWQKQGLWPDASADAYWSYTSLLLSSTSLSNANNNLFVDSSGAFNPVSRNGNTTQGSFTPYGSYWSNYFDGNADWLRTTAINISSGDFTVEAWVYLNAMPTSDSWPGSYTNWMEVLGVGTASIGDGWQFRIGQTVLAFGTNGDTTAVSATHNMVVGQWYHLAVTRSGNVYTLYKNGTSIGSATYTANNPGTGAYTWVGCETGEGAYLNGYISNARIVAGTAVYTSTFTPPAAPLTAISGTSLLTCQSNRFIDTSSNAFAITVNGDTKVQKFSPFTLAAPGVSYNQSDITNWSGYFDGVSNAYVTFPNATQVDLPSNTAFTIEGWIYPTRPNNGAQSGFRNIVSKRVANSLTSNYNIMLNYNSEKMIFYNGATISTSSANILQNAWSHFAYVYNGATSLKLYINGTLDSTFAVAPGATNSAPVTIGSMVDDTGTYDNFGGNISNIRIVKGSQVYTSNFTPPTSPLTAISGTSLLTCQNAAFSDNSSYNAVATIYANATVTGNSPFNTVGYWSNYFDGSGDYLSVPSNAAFQLGTGDFTVEFWINAAASGSYTQTIGTLLTGTEDGTWRIGNRFNNGNEVYFARGNGGGYDEFRAAVNVNDGAWHHVAVTRASGTVRIFIDGALGATSTIAGTCTSSNDLRIGYNQRDNAYLSGYLSNVRIVKGTALYTAAFTPPTAPLTAISGTTLLTCQSSRIVDTSSSALTLTRNGDVSVQSFDPFYTSTIASNGGSMYFDGSGDYLTVPYAGNMRYAGDFTIECWVYPTARLRLYPCIVNNYSTFTSNGGFAIFAGHNSANTSKYNVAFNGSFPFIQSTSDIVYGAWAHIALVRVGSTITLYINGVANGTGTSSATVVGTANNWWVGTAGDSLTDGAFNGYINGLRATPSAVYTAAFTPPTAPVTPTAATTLLLNGMNAGIYDATTINDMETVGNAQVTTAVSKFGGSSIAFDGSGDWLDLQQNSPVNWLGTGDYTIEFWVYGNSWSTLPVLLEYGRQGASNTPGLEFYVSTSGGKLDVYGGSTTGTLLASYSNLPTTTWTHVALTRASGSNRLFINGVQSGTATTDTANYNQAFIRIGAFVNGSNSLNGYIDDLRVTKGVARYTANFTPPTQAFPTY